jgi:hypothetical protein
MSEAEYVNDSLYYSNNKQTERRRAQPTKRKTKSTGLVAEKKPRKTEVLANQTSIDKKNSPTKPSPATDPNLLDLRTPLPSWQRKPPSKFR